MKAAVRSKYGSSEVISILEIDKPIPKDDEVLIRIHAGTVNRSDCHVLTGKPFVMRLFTGLSKPKRSIIGTDFAGQIEAVGSSVNSFKVGDKVMGFGGGFGTGSQAQYKVLPETKATKITVTLPNKLSYDEAAACLEGCFYAATYVNHMKINAGQKALVFGATGAIGSAYLQILKYYGVYVTAVCGGENSALIRSLGADKIIDYKTEDFTKDNEQYDYVFDAIGRSTFAKCKRLLKEKGIFIPSNGLENIFLAPITSLLGGRKVAFMTPAYKNSTLTFIKDLVEKGNFKPVIDRKYPLDKIADAYSYVMTGEKIGNVIITME